tara:strand:+ start:48 stop:362 length:315 start_codon:yes stop_codon:yes gene_type:complete
MATFEEFKEQARTEIEAKKTSNGGDGMYKTVNNIRMEFSDADYEQAILDNATHNYEEQEYAYIDARRDAYPSIEDQLDEIFHNGIDSWKAIIQQVKDDNPKPSE